MEVEQQMSYYNHDADQNKLTTLKGSLEEDKLLIRLVFLKCDEYRVSSHPVFYVNGPLLSQREFWVKFSHFKQQLCDKNDSNLAEYEKLIHKHLKRMRVPIDEHAAIVTKIFKVVKAAISPVDPVVLVVWNITRHIGHDSIIAASRSFIKGLELLTVPGTHTFPSSCVICLEDFEQEPLTRLPCTHHFHIHCIVPWLKINHLCPLCRYPMPTPSSLTVESVSRFVTGILRSVVFSTIDLLEDIREHRLLTMFL